MLFMWHAPLSGKQIYLLRQTEGNGSRLKMLVSTLNIWANKGIQRITKKRAPADLFMVMWQVRSESESE